MKKKQVLSIFLILVMLFSLVACGGGTTDEWNYDESSHWHDGKGGKESDKAAHTYDSGTVTEPTFDTEGYTTYTCTVCGYRKTEAGDKTKEHTYAEEWSFDENTHWHICLDEGYTHMKGNEASHDDANEEVLTPATETTTGWGRYTCSVCGCVYEKIIPIAVKLLEKPTVSGSFYVGQPLSSVTLEGGKADVEGKFAWTNPDETLLTSGEYRYTFTPDNSDYATVTGTLAITAAQLTVTVSAGENGTASPTGVVNVNYGETLKVVFTPKTGYAVEAITLDNETLPAVSTYTLSSITKSHTLSATFKESEISLAITCLEGTENAYSVTGNTLTFTTLSADSIYSISGEHAGNIVIDVGDDYKFELEMHGLTLFSQTDSPVTVVSGNKVTLSAKKGYENTIKDLREGIDTSDETLHAAAIYSAVDLDIEGKGTLTVESENNKGIHTKDDLSVKNLTLSVKCTDNCLKGNDSVTVSGGTITLVATQGDGIKTENSSISEKGKQKGVITLAACDMTIYAACDGIDAAYNAVIEDDLTKLTIYTDKYSNYSEDVPDTPSEEEGNKYYIRFSYQDYRYSVKFCNSDSDYKWVNASLAQTVSDGRTTYYYHAFEMLEGYDSLQIFMYSSDQSQGQDSDYMVATDYITWNTAFDTFALSYRGNAFSYNWTNYSASIGGGPGGMGGGPGGMGGMNDGNTDKGDYSTKGIKAANEVLIAGGTVTVKSYDDAIHSGNDTTLENGASPTGNVTVSGGSLTLYTNDDGIHADGHLTVTSGKIHITNSYEGLEGNKVTISGGDISVISSNDGINSPGTSGTVITIAGGTVYLYANGDGIDSNSQTSGGILFSGGNTVVICTSNGNAAIDSERGYQYTGGSVIAIDSSGGMTQETSNCTNFSSVGTRKSLSLSANAYLTVTVDGDLVATVKMPTSLSSVTVYLGSNSATIASASSTSATLDENGVAWE